MTASREPLDPSSVLELVAWALRAEVEADKVRKVGKWHIKTALAALAMHADSRSCETFVSAARIARDIGVSETDARLLLDCLADQGLIVVDRSRKPHRRRLLATSAGMQAEHTRRDARGSRLDSIRRDTSGTATQHPQGDPQGDPQASLHLSDPIEQPAAAGSLTVNDHTATQLARVAAVLDLVDTDAVATVDRWTDQRAKAGRPIGSAGAVLSAMSDAAIRTDLGRFAPRPTPAAGRNLCPQCRDTNGWREDPDTRKPIGRCRHNNPRGAVA